jgi:hypothetical protein
MHKGTFAVAYTVKDEAALLLASIAYHAAAGCSRFYVFWDGTTDAAPDLLRHRPDVVAMNSVTPDRLPSIRALNLDPGRWAHDTRVRQRVNGAYAAMLAAGEGIEWLLCIDPDELVLADAGRNGIHPDAGVARIDTMLAQMDDTIDQVLVPNIQVVPTGADVEFPFTECTHFYARRPLTRAIWRLTRLALLRTLRSAWLAAWYDYWFYKVVTLGSFPQPMRDPSTGRIVPRGYFLGYYSYKPFIRSRRAERFDFAVHRWLRSVGGKPRSVRAGLVLHYDLFDKPSFVRKFRQRPPRAAIPFDARSYLSKLARELDDSTLKRFFDRNIAVSDERQVARLIASGAIVEIGGPAAFFRRQAERHVRAQDQYRPDCGVSTLPGGIAE